MSNIQTQNKPSCMMAGVLPTKRSTSGRKQWTIHDGPRSSLKRLRSQLANDGCPESQVVLAKQLLEEETDLDDKEESARQGVYWLIKASEQGNVEATNLLKQCLDTGRGISEHNYLDVRSCISMTQDEKLARKAAREMFASLSNGDDYITSDQLQRRMLEIDRRVDLGRIKNQNELQNGYGEHVNGELVNNFEDLESEEEVDWSSRSDSNEKLTEDNLVEAAVNYSHGQLPAVNQILCLNDPNLQALDRIHVMHRSVLHPVLSLRILYYKLIRFLGKYNYERLARFRSDFQIFILLVLYVFTSSENVLYVAPVIVYYSSIGAMVFTTFKMLQTNREFYDFRIWSGLFICYSGGSLNAKQAEYQFICNNLKPYLHFFAALLVNLFTYPVIAEQCIPQSELAIFSFCLTFMTLFGFMYKKRSKTMVDYSILFSFAVNVLAKYPYETDSVVTQGWRFLDLKIPGYASYIVGNGIEFCLKCRYVLYAVIPFVFVHIAHRDNWRGVYKHLIPHCVTLSWLQIVIISSQGATMYGLIRGTLALVGVVMFLPLVGLTSVFLPAAALAKWLVTNDYTYMIVTFLLLAAIGTSVCFLLAKSRFKTLVTVPQMVLAIAAIYFLARSVANDPNLSRQPLVESQKSITYEQYQKFCHEHAWETRNVASTQIRCAKLDDVQVAWEGYVADVKLKSVKNEYRYFIDKLPQPIADLLYCYYGDRIAPDCDAGDEDCLIFHDIVKSNGRCVLDKYNVYDFEVLIRMQSGMWGKSADIVGIMSHHFRNFTLRLRPNDHVWFKGALKQDPLESLGGVRPHVRLSEIGCMACQDNRLSNMKEEVRGGFVDFERIGAELSNGLKTVLTFVFYPLFVFT